MCDWFECDKVTINRFCGNASKKGDCAYLNKLALNRKNSQKYQQEHRDNSEPRISATEIRQRRDDALRALGYTPEARDSGII